MLRCSSHQALFETIGPVAKVTMVVKGARHVATVIFKSGADAAKAQHKYHNIPLDGARARCSCADCRRADGHHHP
jgi:hypothetical protein